MDKPNLAHVERLGQRKPHPNFFKQETKTIASANFTHVSSIQTNYHQPSLEVYLYLKEDSQIFVSLATITPTTLA